MSAQQGWSGTVNTLSTPSQESPSGASVAADATGAAIVAWEHINRIQVARYAVASGWSQTVTLSPRGASPQAAVDPAGNAFVAFGTPDGIDVTRYSVADDTWTAPVTLSPDRSAPSVAVARSGDAAVAWTRSDEIVVSRYWGVTGAWSVPQAVSIGADPRIVLDGAGNAVVVSLGGPDQGVVQAVRYSAVTRTWSGVTVLGTLAGGHQVGIDAQGNATVLWYTRTVPSLTLQVVRFDAATQSWTAPVTMGICTSFVELAVAANGHVVVAWEDHPDVRTIRTTRYTGSAAGWSTPTVVTSGDHYLEDVGVDGDGSATAILRRRVDQLIVASRNVAGSAIWSTPVTLSSAGLQAAGAQIAVASTGTSTVAWRATYAAYGAIQATSWVAAPGVPTMNVVTADDQTLAVAFTAPSITEPALAPTNYAYSLDDGATWTPRDPPSTTSPLVIAGLTDGVRYAVRLRAINSAGPGMASTAVIAIPGPGSAAPAGLHVAEVAGNTVTLRWQAPVAGAVPTNYLLEGGVNPGEVLASIPAGSMAPTFTFVAPTGAFYVRMHALAGALRSAPSNEIRIFVNVPTPPSAPANLLGLANGSTIALSWTNTFAGGAPTNLWLDVTGALTTTLPLPMGEAFTYVNVPPGTYTLSVSAANASGASPPSNAVTLTFPGDGCSGVPGAPTNLQTWKVGNTIFLLWSSPATGPAVTSYAVSVAGAYVGSFATTGRTLSGVAAPGSYVINVSASNACGAGAATPAQTVVIP